MEIHSQTNNYTHNNNRSAKKTGARWAPSAACGIVWY